MGIQYNYYSQLTKHYVRFVQTPLKYRRLHRQRSGESRKKGVISDV